MYISLYKLTLDCLNIVFPPLCLSACGHFSLSTPSYAPVSLAASSFSGHHHREKRQAHDHRKNTCPLLLVADYRFFRHMGRGQESVTLNYLVRLYDAV